MATATIARHPQEEAFIEACRNRVGIRDDAIAEDVDSVNNGRYSTVFRHDPDIGTRFDIEVRGSEVRAYAYVRSRRTTIEEYKWPLPGEASE